MFVRTEAMAEALVVFSLSPTKEGCTMSAPRKMPTDMTAARGVLSRPTMTKTGREDIASQRMVNKILICLHTFVVGAVPQWLVRLTLDRAVLVLGQAGVIVLCSWAGHFTLTVLLSTNVFK